MACILAFFYGLRHSQDSWWCKRKTNDIVDFLPDYYTTLKECWGFVCKNKTDDYVTSETYISTLFCLVQAPFNFSALI